ncbi:MAG: hypothetical protein RIQ81_1374 [Pseudomonadota bacterium]|jgi:endonuclease YncB( thermonuclease family)
MKLFLRRNKGAALLGAGLAFAIALVGRASEGKKTGGNTAAQEASVSSVSKETTVDSGSRMPATIKHCNDGDTCRIVTTPGHMWMNVRLAGIDAPERANKRKKSKGQPLGDEAADFLNRSVADKTVEIEQVDLDAYNRPVVVIWLEQKNFNIQLVEQGYAEVYRGPTKRLDRQEFEAAETRAKAAKKGIWALPSDVRQSPAEYRKELRQRDNLR